MRLGLIGALSAFALATSFIGGATAQTYPTKPIRLILAYPPGGAIDFIGRTAAQRLSENIGQTVVVENKPGAGGIVATDFVVRAAPDGYTVLLTDPSIATTPSLQDNLPYDLFKDLKTVSVVGSSPNVLVVTNSLPVKSVSELIAYGKQNPGKLNYASSGVGTSVHLAAELLKASARIEATHVPYRGMAQSMADLVAGKVHMAFSSPSAAMPFISSNNIRPIATTGTKRSSAFPDLPTVQEAGVPGFYVDLWTALFVPAATPDNVVAKLSDELRKALSNPETKAALAKLGTESRGTSPQEGLTFVRSEHDRWRKVIKDANIQQ
jgi:tripartite-type tricarboxylate transporter receptor subunit TctC